MRSPAAPPPLPVQRRKHTRQDLRMSAEIRTAQAAFTATTRDLSEGGAGLESTRPLTEGEQIALGLFLVIDGLESDTPPLWVKARVVWVGETDAGTHTAGVRFEVITDDQRRWLGQVMSQMSSRHKLIPR